jgi:hypothetical protein
MPTGLGCSAVLDADEDKPGVAGLCAFVGGGSVPTTDTSGPPGDLLAECWEGRGECTQGAVPTIEARLV